LNALGTDVAADLQAMALLWSPAAREELQERTVALATAGVPPAAALIVAVGVLLHD
jgi:hypothetical protein